jgi:quinolinate synthase
MADMADIDQVEEAWDSLQEICDGQRIIPITYMNSAANLKAFVGRNGGAVCTSSNAKKIMDWALKPIEEGGAGGEKLLFFPDQHLGRNTAVLEMGFLAGRLRRMGPVPRTTAGRATKRCASRGFCCGKATARCTARFMPIHVDNVRQRYPGYSRCGAS